VLDYKIIHFYCILVYPHFLYHRLFSIWNIALKSRTERTSVLQKLQFRHTNTNTYTQNINFKVCQSVHHHTLQVNQPTRCNSFSSLLLDVYVRLNLFRESSRPSSGAQQLQWQPLVLPSEHGDSSAVGRGRTGPTTTDSTAITTLRR